MHLRCVARRSPSLRASRIVPLRGPYSASLAVINTPQSALALARLDWGYEAFSPSGAASTNAPPSRSPLKAEGLSAISASHTYHLCGSINSAALREKSIRLCKRRATVARYFFLAKPQRLQRRSMNIFAAAFHDSSRLMLAIAR